MFVWSQEGGKPVGCYGSEVLSFQGAEGGRQPIYALILASECNTEVEVFWCFSV